MTLSPELTALRDEAMAVSCEAWALQKRWVLSRGIDRAGPCPVCGGTDRFSIHTRDNIFNCRKCGISGSGVIDLVIKTEKVDFVAACEIITGRKASEPQSEQRMAELRREAERNERKRTAAADAYRERARTGGARDLARLGGSTSKPMGVQRVSRTAGLDPAVSPTASASRCGSIPSCRGPRSSRTPRRATRAGARCTLGPAMLAAVQMPDDRFGGVHMTWIDLDQPKGKLLLPPDEKGKPRPSKKVRGPRRAARSRCSRPGDRRRIVMGEGIETTLTPLCHALEPETAYWAGVDLSATWRQGAARRWNADPRPAGHGRCECFEPPDWCEEWVLLGEGDDASVHSREKCLRGSSGPCGGARRRGWIGRTCRR
jgi:hypothetical protein